MTFSERIWKAAADTFGKKRGHANPLTPYTRTWRLVIDRAEHALWKWNDEHGPLNAVQREYAAELVEHALAHAQTAPDCNAVYAFFNTRLTHLLNHEKVQAGFRHRVSAADEAEAILDADSVFQAVPE